MSAEKPVSYISCQHFNHRQHIVSRIPLPRYWFKELDPSLENFQVAFQEKEELGSFSWTSWSESTNNHGAKWPRLKHAKEKRRMFYFSSDLWKQLGFLQLPFYLNDVIKDGENEHNGWIGILYTVFFFSLFFCTDKKFALFLPVTIRNSWWCATKNFKRTLQGPWNCKTESFTQGTV